MCSAMLIEPLIETESAVNDQLTDWKMSFNARRLAFRFPSFLPLLFDLPHFLLAGEQMSTVARITSQVSQKSVIHIFFFFAVFSWKDVIVRTFILFYFLPYLDDGFSLISLCRISILNDLQNEAQNEGWQLISRKYMLFAK